ncbi:hypothetical protein RCL1_003103 [Eukaryota sp. TZLM3-RCL]
MHIFINITDLSVTLAPLLSAFIRASFSNLKVHAFCLSSDSSRHLSSWNLFLSNTFSTSVQIVHPSLELISWLPLEIADALISRTSPESFVYISQNFPPQLRHSFQKLTSYTPYIRCLTSDSCHLSDSRICFLQFSDLVSLLNKRQLKTAVFDFITSHSTGSEPLSMNSFLKIYEENGLVFQSFLIEDFDSLLDLFGLSDDSSVDLIKLSRELVVIPNFSLEPPVVAQIPLSVVDKVQEHVEPISQQLHYTTKPSSEIVKLQAENASLQEKIDSMAAEIETYKTRIGKLSAWIETAKPKLVKRGIIPKSSAPVTSSIDVISVSDEENETNVAPKRGEKTVEKQQVYSKVGEKRRQDAAQVFETWDVPLPKRKALLEKISGPPSSPFDNWLITGPKGEVL